MKCQNCGKDFIPRVTNQKFCSIICNNRSSCRRYHERHLDKERKRKLKWYHDTRKSQSGLKRIREVNRRANEKRRFGLQREKIIKQFKNRCVYCGKIPDVPTIHHIDNIGRNSIKPNNKKNNLVLCCKPCHARIHLGGFKLQMKRKSDTLGN